MLARRGLSVCPSRMYVSYVTRVQHAKAVGRNEMPFGRDTRVVQSNSVGQGPGPSREGEICSRNPQLAATPPRLLPNYFGRYFQYAFDDFV